jgi:hypothetical protein
MIERFWRWLYAYCAERIRAAYMQRVGWDLKCPHCQSWSSLVGIEMKSWNAEQSRYLCLQCDTKSAWHFEGPVAWPVPIKYFNRIEGDQP